MFSNRSYFILLVCQGIQCGRTKLQSIAENVLCPLSIESHLKSLSDKPFTVSTDASNKSYVKLFPIVITYFDVITGINNFVLDFFEDSNESAYNIYKHLIESFNNNSIKIDNIIAFTADNASVNYGVRKSVYENLKIQNPRIVKANCNAHVLHNTARHAFDKLPLDIENLIMKIYSHFCNSAKRVESLKSCYEFCAKEFEPMKRHVITRWLSLFPAINRIIDNIEPLKNYFIGLGTNDCPLIIQEFVWSDSYKGVTVFELYLHFSAFLMNLFHKNILLFEKKTTNATNLYSIMAQIRNQLINRVSMNFYGSKVSEYLKNFPETDQKMFIKNLL